MKKGDRIRVEFDLELPVDASPAEVQAWLNYELNWDAMLKNNPLETADLEASFVQPSFRRVFPPEAAIRPKQDAGDIINGQLDAERDLERSRRGRRR